MTVTAEEWDLEVKIGLCYDFQILEKIPTEIHDVPMNFVITEKEILEIR